MIEKILEKTRERIGKIEPGTFPKRKSKVRNFKEAVKKGFVIAELKPASPSAGKLREFDPSIARELEKGGACALSVLTEPYFFGGNLRNLEEAKSFSKLPVLRKEFIIDPLQIEESYAYGADAVLLLSEYVPNLKDMIGLVGKKGMHSLVEAETEDGLKKAIKAGADIIGVNNRNLKTLETDLKRSERLIPLIPKGKVIISESGIETREEAGIMKKLGAHAILVGTSIMRSGNPAEKVRELSGG